MTIPFLSYFKKGKNDGAAKEATAPKPVLPPLEKPSSERFSKTVMPNATRTLAPQDPFEMAARATTLGVQMPAAATAVAPAPRTVSFSPNSSAIAAQRGLPPAVALALEPQVERVISIELGDLLSGMPEGFVKPLESIDTSRRVLLKASEVEKGMATGKPTVLLATVYQQMPEAFIRKIDAADTSVLNLPFNKVLDAFAKMHVRADQERAHAVPQVETPFLKVTLEDNETFGTVTEPLETFELPPVRMQPPTAEAFAAAEPEVAAEARLKMSAPPSTNGATQPKRIPFKLSPNGTDAPAPESVPASSGPSVPSLLPSPLAAVSDPKADAVPSRSRPVEKAEPQMPPTLGSALPTPAPPVRIPFKMVVTPPTVDQEAAPKKEPWLTKESFETNDQSIDLKGDEEVVAEKPRPTEAKISLPLLPILKSLPPMQLTGDPGSVPADVRLELPFALVEPQLASGRVTIAAKVFELSMPQSFRGLFQAGPGALDVLLPLQEILKNLPATSLRMRDDQEEQDAGQNFATPFSAKAEEDAKRFNVPATPVAKPVIPEPAAAPEPVTAEVTERETGKTDQTAAAVDNADRPLRTPLQVALATDEKLDAKGVVALVNKIPGVKSCAILFGDGLSLAGSLPGELETEGICAMAPSLMQRLENHLVDTKLGLLRGMTLSCTKGAITFYMHENLCLAALHADLDLPGETREKLSRVVHEMSRKYSHPV
jgi:predicted regulator of Ras-like GTPase activity (Roadblock/LC7/MglB family)